MEIPTVPENVDFDDAAISAEHIMAVASFGDVDTALRGMIVRALTAEAVIERLTGKPIDDVDIDAILRE